MAINNQQLTMNGKIYCFRASYELSIEFDEGAVPEWLSVGVNWQGYRISTLPWIADVARALGIIELENTPLGWISYLESLGLKDVIQVTCEDMFEDKLYC